MRDVKATWHGAAFVCTHERDPDKGKPWCGLERGSDLRDWLKQRVKDEGLKGEILLATSGCLGICSAVGVTVAILPGPDRGLERQVLVFADGSDREALWQRIRSGLIGPS